MRLGRIILALLAPLISFSAPAKPGIPSEQQPPGIDSLAHSILGLLNTHSLDAQVNSHAGKGSVARLFVQSAADFINPAKLALPRIELAASLNLSSRQSRKLLLRC